MDNLRVFEHEQRREDLFGEPLHHRQRKSAELVLGEYVQERHAQQLEDEADVALELEAFLKSNDMPFIARILRI